MALFFISQFILDPVQSSFSQHHSIKTGLLKITNAFLVTKPKGHIWISIYWIFEHHLSLLTIPYLKHYPLLASIMPYSSVCLTGCVIVVLLIAISLLNIGILQDLVLGSLFFSFTFCLKVISSITMAMTTLVMANIMIPKVMCWSPNPQYVTVFEGRPFKMWLH